jgi:glycosyltransferase involved in cell wall biosynthesis
MNCSREPRRTPFGRFARVVAGLEDDVVRACVQEQKRSGRKLGELLVARGLLTRAQVAEVLALQARERAAQAPGLRLPHPAFLSLCLPAYNEQGNIEDTLDAACAILPAFVARFEIVVVNDGSTDQTAERVARRAESEPHIRLINHESNLGYGAAVTSGLRAATGDLIAFVDSDGQFSLLDLPSLLGLLGRYDVAIGYRVRRADPVHRRFNAWTWNQAVRVALGVRVVDLDCAFKVFPRRAVQGLHSLVGSQAFNADLLYQCRMQGLSIGETPVAHYPRGHGVQTGARPAVILRAVRDLVGLWWNTRKHTFVEPPRPERPRVGWHDRPAEVTQ